MNLVDYSDSDDGESEGQVKKLNETDKAPQSSSASNASFLKRKRSGNIDSDLPPLPSLFHDLYAVPTRISQEDDSSLHSGRHRVTPHVEGNWPTHLYIEWYPSQMEAKVLNVLLSTLRRNQSLEHIPLYSLLSSDLGAELPLHISLSRSLALDISQRQLFIDLLAAAVAGSGIRPFQISVNGLKWVSNLEKSRWFLVLGVEKPAGDGLNKALCLSNQLAETFGQPPLYAAPQPVIRPSEARGRGQRFHGRGFRSRACSGDIAPQATPNQDFSTSFHISIGWTLEAPSQESIDKLVTIDLQDIKGFKINVDSLKAKVGNIITAVALPTQSKMDKSHGIIGS